MIVQLAARAGRVTNALAAINLQLQIMPDDPATLWNKAALEMKIGNFSGAIPMFTRVLTIQSNNYNALLARAFSYVEAGQFDEGQRDYEDLRKYFPTSIDVNTGLAEIYWRRHETNSAIHYYELALTNSNPNPKQLEFINERLKSLKGAPP
jgi:tetratricopeptide (TPR) repeat protein